MAFQNICSEGYTQFFSVPALGIFDSCLVTDSGKGWSGAGCWFGGGIWMDDTQILLVKLFQALKLWAPMFITAHAYLNGYNSVIRRQPPFKSMDLVTLLLRNRSPAETCPLKIHYFHCNATLIHVSSDSYHSPQPLADTGYLLILTIFAGSMSPMGPNPWAPALIGHSTNSYARSWCTGPWDGAGAGAAWCIGHSDGGETGGDGEPN